MVEPSSPAVSQGGSLRSGIAQSALLSLGRYGVSAAESLGAVSVVDMDPAKGSKKFSGATARVAEATIVSNIRERIALAVPTTILVLAVVGVPVMVLGSEGLPRHRRLQGQLDAQREENRRLGRDVQQLEAALEAFNRDPRARERAVREELGWVRPDEIVVEVPNREARGGAR
jgi:cell division protein FtsB